MPEEMQTDRQTDEALHRLTKIFKSLPLEEARKREEKIRQRGGVRWKRPSDEEIRRLVEKKRSHVPGSS